MNLQTLTRGQAIYVLGSLYLHKATLDKVDHDGRVAWYAWSELSTFAPLECALSEDVFVDYAAAMEEQVKRLSVALDVQKSALSAIRKNKRHAA